MPSSLFKATEVASVSNSHKPDLKTQKNKGQPVESRVKTKKKPNRANQNFES